MKPLELTAAFRRQARAYPKKARTLIGNALSQLERDFGHPHRHQGLGVRKLRGNYFEIRAGLDVRLVFQNRKESLLFLMAGNHDDVQSLIRDL